MRFVQARSRIIDRAQIVEAAARVELTRRDQLLRDFKKIALPTIIAVVNAAEDSIRILRTAQQMARPASSVVEEVILAKSAEIRSILTDAAELRPIENIQPILRT